MYPGEVAEFDWGEVEVTVGGRRQKAQILCYRVRWSGMPFVVAYPNAKKQCLTGYGGRLRLPVAYHFV